MQNFRAFYRKSIEIWLFGLYKHLCSIFIGISSETQISYNIVSFWFINDFKYSLVWGFLKKKKVFFSFWQKNWERILFMKWFIRLFRLLLILHIMFVYIHHNLFVQCLIISYAACIIHLSFLYLLNIWKKRI